MKKVKTYKKINIFIYLSIIFIFFNYTLVLCVDLKGLIERIYEKEKQINTIKADYTQTINFVDLKEIYEIKAGFLFVKPDKVRIDVIVPLRQTIVADSNSIKVKDNITNVIYDFNSKKYFEKNHNYLPLIFSNKNMKYTITDFIKKTGLKFVTEEDKYYVLSSRYFKGKMPTDKDKGLKPGETRFMLWVDKETLFPRKVSMVSEKYIVDTEFDNFEINFAADRIDFEIEKTTDTKIIKVE
ncbi:MAG: outer-membrane lipoprotein carrier protein LolA [Endomicrobia bacterium]|nr:outer-membrane lipoprotein carrier protein LolA [Endomicrobiia bacterium]